MTILLKTQAIQTALTGNWKNAITLNQELLEENPEDIETLNRLAFAFSILGKVKEAKQTYQKVLHLDNQNPIAIRNLKRLTETPKRTASSSNTPIFSVHPDTLFLEESGKTKVIDLINVAEPKVISTLMTTETLELRIKRLKIFVLDKNNHYIGMLPDDIGKRLIRLLKAGNKYETYIKSTENHKVCIFIKETKRSARFKNQPSFVSAELSKQFLPKKNYTHKSDLEDAVEPEEEA